MHDEIVVFEVMTEALVGALPPPPGARVSPRTNRDPRIDRHPALTEAATKDIDQLFLDLAKSPFRRRFLLGRPELRYLERKGLNSVLAEGADFLSDRLAATSPPNDGRQTPFKGHPVFIAQHATATCCRGCLANRHGIEKGKELRPAELAHVSAVIENWLRKQPANIPEEPAQGRLI